MKVNPTSAREEVTPNFTRIAHDIGELFREKHGGMVYYQEVEGAVAEWLQEMYEVGQENPASPPPSGPQVSSQVSSGDDYANRRETSLLETKGGVSLTSPSNGVTQEESSDRVNARTASTQSGPLESNSVAPNVRPEPEYTGPESYNFGDPPSRTRDRLPHCQHGVYVGVCKSCAPPEYVTPKASAPSRTRGEEKMPDEFPDFSRKTEYVDEPVAAKSVKPSAPDAGQPVITVSRGAPPGVGEPPWASAPASAAREQLNEILRREAATLARDLRHGAPRNDQWKEWTFDSMKRAAEAFAAEQTRQLRSELADNYAWRQVESKLRLEYMQRAQAAEAERDKEVAAHADTKKKLRDIQERGNSSVTDCD